MRGFSTERVLTKKKSWMLNRDGCGNRPYVIWAPGNVPFMGLCTVMIFIALTSLRKNGSE